MDVTPENVFREICWMDVAVNDYVKLISVPRLSDIFQTSKYKIRKCLSALKEQGLVVSGCESAYDEWNERYVIVNGFGVTKHGTTTEVYKAAAKQETDLIYECFGGTSAPELSNDPECGR